MRTTASIHSRWLRLITALQQYTLFAVLCSLILTSCITEEEAYTDNTPTGNFEALWTIMDRQYCFFDYKHVNWDSIHAEYRPRAQAALGTQALFDVLCDMLAELRDGHVNLSYAADFGHYWAWKENYPDNFDTELQESYLGTDYNIAGGLNYRTLDGNIAYVTCNSFSVGFGDGNLDYIMGRLMLADGMIVDVRDNSGGSLEYAEALAARFTNEKRLVGYSMFKTGLGHNEFSTPMPEYIEPSKGYRWQKPVVVLTNRSCYSATNTFVRNMKAIAEAEAPSADASKGQRRITVIGDSTGGGSGLPMVSELPNGWLVRYSASPMLDVNKEHIEFGIAPDIYCTLDSTLALQGIDSMIEQAKSMLKSKNIH